MKNINELKAIISPTDEQKNRMFSKIIKPKSRINFALIAACFIIVLATPIFTMAYIQNNASEFYLRYLTPEEMAVSNAMAEQYGAKIYFDALKTDDVYKQYFAINKLALYFNDEEIRTKAIKAITPFLESKEEKLSSSAKLALSILKKEYNDPNIFHLYDGSVIFTLFNDYSDYGSYNEIWRIKDGELSVFWAGNEPKMYITSITLSPDKKKVAIQTCSNKSQYLEIINCETGITSLELVDSARIKLNADMLQRADFENYSTIENFRWIDNENVEFTGDFSYNGGEVVKDNVRVKYKLADRKLGFE